MGDYDGCAFAYWQFSVSSQHMVKSLTQNPYMSLSNLKLCTHIWSTNINFIPKYIGLFGPSLSELSPYGWIWGVGDRLGLQHFFVTDRNVTTYVASRSVREARLKRSKNADDRLLCQTAVIRDAKARRWMETAGRRLSEWREWRLAARFT